MQSSFNEFSKRRKVQQPTDSVSSLLTYRQEATGTNEKIESTLSRLGRLTAEDPAAGDERGFKRKMVLFEYVVLVHHKPAFTLTTPQSSRRNQGQTGVHFEKNK